MENSNPVQEPGISEYYNDYKQTQAEMIALYSRKTRNSILTVAALWLGSELLGFAMTNVFSTAILLSALIVPAAFAAVAFIGLKQPLTAVIIAAAIFVGMWVLTIVVLGGAGAVSGLLIKALIIYFLIAGFQNAREVEKLKKEIAN